MWLAVASCALVRTWMMIRWVVDGQILGALTNGMVVLASVVWCATIGRRYRGPTSSWDPMTTVVRVSPRTSTRAALSAGVLLLWVTVPALFSHRHAPTAVGAVFAVLLMSMSIAGSLGWTRMLRSSELRLTPDEIVLSMPRGFLPGVVTFRRFRRGVDGYRRRFGGLELMPWPPPGGGSGGSRRRINVPTQVLARADVERALKLHGIRPV